MASSVELLPAELIERVLAKALAGGGDLAEVFAERVETTSLSLDDHQLDSARSGFDLGASIRVVAGESTMFGYVDGLEEADLLRLAGEVASAVKSGRSAPRGV